MEPETVQQLHGAKDLIRDSVDAATKAIGEIHQAIARRPFAVLAQIPTIAPVAQRVETVQFGITSRVYRGIRAANRVAGKAAGVAIDVAAAVEPLVR